MRGRGASAARALQLLPSGPLLWLAPTLAVACAYLPPLGPAPVLVQERVNTSWRPAECVRAAACDELMVVAHRGHHLRVPENSLAAIRAAADLGTDFAEVDVRHTSDEVIVLMHDESVDDTTDGSGQVDELSWEQCADLRLAHADAKDPDTQRIPRLTAALGLARERSLMLYVDLKTERWDLVLAEIQSGDYYDEALVRVGDLDTAAELAAADDRLLVMPAVSDDDEAREALARIPDLRIVELSRTRAQPRLTAAIRALGLKVQQDVLVVGDWPARRGDYRGWKAFVDAGVFLLQTDRADLLLPAVWRQRSTGEFPASSTARPLGVTQPASDGRVHQGRASRGMSSSGGSRSASSGQGWRPVSRRNS